MRPLFLCREFVYYTQQQKIGILYHRYIIQNKRKTEIGILYNGILYHRENQSNGKIVYYTRTTEETKSRILYRIISAENFCAICIENSRKIK